VKRHFAASALLVSCFTTLGFVSAFAGEPGLVIHLKTGAGTIRAGKIWEQNDQLCWEAPNSRKCLPKEEVSFVSIAGQPGAAAQQGSSPRRISATNPGSDLEGTGAGTGAGAFENYLTMVDRRIQDKWIPMGAAKKPIRVRFQILRSGEVTGVAIEQSSGDSAADASALQAVRQSAPFPPFPDLLMDASLDLRYQFAVGR